MLAMRSYEQNEGFSVMTADELYYVNGGSGSSVSIGNAGKGTPTNTGRYIASEIIAALGTIGNGDPTFTQAVAQGWYEAMGGKYRQ